MKTNQLYLVLIILVGFAVYWFVKDSIFKNEPHSNKNESFESTSIPGRAPIEIRQAPIYPERTVSPSGPNPPNQAAPEDEVVVYADPTPQDPYNLPQESSDIPENLRYPERSFRPTVENNRTNIAVEGGIASNNIQVTSDNSQKFAVDMIQNGGEFMSGIYANDTFSDTNYSAI